MATTPTQAEKGPLERVETKLDNMKAAELKEGAPKGISAALTDTQLAKSGQTTDSKTVNIGQGLNANGEADAKENFETFPESTVKIQGQTKILREAGDSNTGKPAAVDRVQTGGGGTVDGRTGKAV